MSNFWEFTMNRMILIFALLLFSLNLESCSNRETVSENKGDSGPTFSEEDSLKYIGMILDFNFYKSKFLTSFSSKEKESYYADSMSIQWNLIQENKKSVIELLLKFRGSEAKTLYGERYKEIKLRGVPLPDKVHSLYLIECIQRNDYLFNRRYRNYLHPRYFFSNDGLNFVYSKRQEKELTSWNYQDTIDLGKTDKFLELAWDATEEYFNDQDNFNRSEPIPLGSDLKWNTLSLVLTGTDSSDYFNSKIGDEYYRKKHFFYFMTDTSTSVLMNLE
jgi:hypothetical protein